MDALWDPEVLQCLELPAAMIGNGDTVLLSFSLAELVGTLLKGGVIVGIL